MTQRSLSSSHRPPPAEAYWLGRWFTAARREGLLALLPADVWRTLCALLSFTSRDGRRSFTIDQLAVALGQPREQALSRLDALTHAEWKEQPLATMEYNQDGDLVGAVLAPVEVLAGARSPVPVDPEAPPAESRAATGDASAADLARDLQAVGLNPDQIEWLTRTFPQDRIRRQLGWLPARQARNPAAMLIRAVEQDWGPPREAA
jgi:hypothetical protein